MVNWLLIFIKMQALISMICTVFYVGLIPFAPGTFGSIAGLALAAAVKFDIITMTFLSGIIFVVGYVFSDIYSKIIRNPDPKEVVIDEVVGMLIALIIAFLFAEKVLNIYYVNEIRHLTHCSFMYNGIIALFSLILFRFFDITKPGTIRRIEQQAEGGMGIMLDDVIAGIYAGVSFIVLSPFAILLLQIFQRPLF